MRFRTFGTFATVVALTFGFAGAAYAEEDDGKLEVGDPAPGLDIEKWVKGQETTIQQGSYYVVEFWATWCGPCKQSIPHLTELQHKYESDGLTIIGVSTEDAKVVESFVNRQGDRMDYTVAVDRSESTQRAWMEAAGQKGIPCAFIVDTKSRIAFIGHPLSGEFEGVLEAVIEGRYDPKLEKEARPSLEAAERARKLKNYKLAFKHLDEVIELDPRVFARLQVEKFEIMLVDMGNKDEAYSFARTLMTKYGDDLGLQRVMAETIATDPKIPDDMRDLELAKKMAEAAMRGPAGEEPRMIATLARVNYEMGDVDQAIQLQTKAWLAAPPGRKPAFKETLEEYQLAQKRGKAAAKAKANSGG